MLGLCGYGELRPIQSLDRRDKIGDENIPSKRAGRAMGLAKATATRERTAINVNCMIAMCVS